MRCSSLFFDTVVILSIISWLAARSPFSVEGSIVRRINGASMA